MNPDTLKAGRELDALVAEKIMGLGPERWDPPCFWYHTTDDAEPRSGWCYTCSKAICEVPGEPRRYSTSISDAWLVVEKMAAHPTNWYFMVGPDGYLTAENGGSGFDICADTAPLAICLAALRATGGLTED